MIPAGVAFIQAGGSRGRVAVVRAEEPFGSPAELLPGIPGRAETLGVVHGRHGMHRLIHARLEPHHVEGAWYRCRAALDELRAQWRCGGVIWVAALGDTSDAAARTRGRTDLRLLAEPPQAPWLARADPSARASRPLPDGLPADLPAELHAVAGQVLEVLDRIAKARGASIVPTLAAVGRAIGAYRQRDHLAVALELEHWMVHGDGQRYSARDVVARYRNQLARKPAEYGAAKLTVLPGGYDQAAGL